MDLLEHSICTLTRQGALTADESLTVMGEILTQLPVDLSVGKVSDNDQEIKNYGPSITPFRRSFSSHGALYESKMFSPKPSIH